MKKIVLEGKTRDLKKEKNQKGWVKGVVYGPELKDNVLVWVKLQDFNKAYNQAGQSTLVDLKIKEGNGHSVLFYKMQYDALSNDLVHVDFYKVKMGEKIDATVELEFIDEAPAIKEQGGILIKSLDSLEVRCFPRHLISKIQVSLADLKELDDSIYVKDIKVPSEVEITTNSDTAVVSISRPRSEEEIEELDEKVEMDVDQVEVEKGGEDDKEAEGEESDDSTSNSSAEGASSEEDKKAASAKDKAGKEE